MYQEINGFGGECFIKDMFTTEFNTTSDLIAHQQAKLT